jgi:tRNA modification GTPase
MTDTIFALSSGHGRSGVAIVRLSGPKVRECLRTLTPGKKIIPRMAELLTLYNPDSKDPIDRGLVLFFEGPASFTGEDVTEFHLHGSKAVLDEMFEVLGMIDGLRAAEPGEFTRRAFENGKMDLTEVEGLADLIDAETKAQKTQAFRQANGALGKGYDLWRTRLVKASAFAEADIDFADEDLPQDLWNQAGPLVEDVYKEIQAHLRDDHRGERLRDGYRVAILGAPNVGKSSFINLLARRDVAIVSDEPGTTRDVVEVHLNLGGFAVIAMDTAGLREGVGFVESEGIRRARRSAAAADLRVWIGDISDYPDPGPGCEDRREGDILLWNKVDTRPDVGPKAGEHKDVFYISAKEERGIGAVLGAMEEKVRTDLERPEVPTTEFPGLTRARHRKELDDCLVALARLIGRSKSHTGMDSDLLAEDLRQATRSLGRLTGRVNVDEILDHIFRDFCIGK